MERIHIEASTAYDVIIEDNVLQHITDYIEPLKSPVPQYSSAMTTWHRSMAHSSRISLRQRATRYMNTSSPMVKLKKMPHDS